MSQNKKKPSIAGFKPSNQDWVKLCELVDFFQEKQVIGSVTVTDIMKVAVDDLYKKHIDNPKNRYGAK